MDRGAPPTKAIPSPWERAPVQTQLPWNTLADAAHAADAASTGIAAARGPGARRGEVRQGGGRGDGTGQGAVAAVARGGAGPDFVEDPSHPGWRGTPPTRGNLRNRVIIRNFPKMFRHCAPELLPGPPERDPPPNSAQDPQTIRAGGPN